jgi:hypothetical protein
LASILENNLRSGNSGLRWNFDKKIDIQGAYLEKDLKWQNGLVIGNIEVAAGRVANSDWWLNLKRRLIDTSNVLEVKLRIFSDSDSEIYFFHQQVSDNALHGSERIKIQKGWQDITLRLNEPE